MHFPSSAMAGEEAQVLSNLREGLLTPHRKLQEEWCRQRRKPIVPHWMT